MSKNKEIEISDSQLFREAIGSVTPVKHDAQLQQRTKPKPWPMQRVADERQALKEMALGLDLGDLEISETGDELYFKRDGVQSRLFQKLKRGQLPSDYELDLHGMTIAVAKVALGEFLTRAKSAQWRCVRIIHGKGRGSPNGVPILKGKLNAWLRRRDEILAFASARPVDGGTGAMYVLLKRQGGRGRR